jgi:hypothetical protein
MSGRGSENWTGSWMLGVLTCEINDHRTPRSLLVASSPTAQSRFGCIGPGLQVAACLTIQPFQADLHR